MPKINSRQKGAAGERELAKTLQALFGCDARRGCQFSGGGDSPDVVSSIDGLHFEVKRVEKLNIDNAMAQSERDCEGGLPVVAHRKNRKDWLFTCKLNDLPEVTKILSKFVQ